MDEASELSEDIEAVALVHELSQMIGSRCKVCAAVLCGHELLMCIVAGYRHSPQCLSCLSRAMGNGREETRNHLYHYIMHRACRRTAWLWASREEGLAIASPACLWFAGVEEEGPPQAHMPAEPDAHFRNRTSDTEWDAGKMGCGELVMKLRLRLQAMHPGQVLKLTATDNGVPEDIPAWCRLTGHKLVSSNQPEYWIQRREK